MISYSITMCNLNMKSTLQRSVESILNCTGSEFEVIVVDDGSNDGSDVVLKSLERKYDRVRVFFLNRDRSRRLGATRNYAIQQARGEYVLTQLDVDDKYDCYILDFVKIFHLLENAYSKDFYLKGNSINMGKKDFLLKYGPYSNIYRGEDKDLWRRLYENDEIVFLSHKPFWSQLGYFKPTSRKILNFYDATVNDFRTGVMLRGYFSWILRKYSILDLLTLLKVILVIPAYIEAKYLGSIITPARFKKGEIEAESISSQKTIFEIAESNGIELPSEFFESRFKKVFL